MAKVTDREPTQERRMRSMGSGGIDEGCRPCARTGVKEEGAWAAATATRKVVGPEPTPGEEEEEHGRLRRQRRRLLAPSPCRRGGGWSIGGSGNDKVAGPVPVEEDEGACFVTPVAGSASAPEEEEERARAAVATT